MIKKFIKKLRGIKTKKILYASHALSDSAHILGIKFSFNDYYDQLQKTLSFIYNNDSSNTWVIRTHPASLLLNE